MTNGGQVILEFGFDGTAGWSFTPGTGVTTLDGAALEVLRESVTSATRPPRRAMRLVHRGLLKLEEEFVNHVLMIDAAGDSAQMYYAMSPGLLFAMEVPTEVAKSGPQFFFFRDYKPFGGRQTPTSITMLARGPSKGVQRVVHMSNDQIPDERFRRPEHPR